VYGYAESGDLSIARRIARERAGKDASDEEVEERMPRANEPPTPTTPDGISARNERKQRALRRGTGG